jgi:hypothetical protein
MNIKERIKKISDYFKEMQVIDVDGVQTIYVVVKFPNGWRIDSTLEEKYKTIVEIGNEPNEFYFFTELENEENVFNAIEYNIEKMKDAIERATLLKQKINELKDLFQDESISIQTLRTLSFKMENEFIISSTLIDTSREIFNINEDGKNFQETNTNEIKTEVKDTDQTYTTFNKKDKKNKN